MSFRTRLAAAGVATALVSLAVLAFGLRVEATRRLDDQYRARVDALAARLRQDLALRGDEAQARVSAIARSLASDDRFRAALAVARSDDRAYVIDAAPRAMAPAGLGMLRIEDQDGRLLSAGEFRNAFGTVDRSVPPALEALGGRAALVRASTSQGPVLSLAWMDSASIAGRWYRVIGGVNVDSTALAALIGDAGLGIVLATPGHEVVVGDTTGGVGATVTTIDLPFVDATLPAAPLDVARFTVRHTSTGLRVLRRAFDRWILLALAAATLVAMLATALLARGVMRPLTRLADRVARYDVDGLETSFTVERTDELGALERAFADLTERVRSGTARLRAVERRAATGDLARQVNHDVKNGLIPLRNVFRHLSEVAAHDPAHLAATFAERRGTVEASLAYLERLATQYAKLSPDGCPEACDPARLAEAIADGARRSGATVFAHSTPDVPTITADPVALRRVLENLVANGLDSLPNVGGAVTLTTSARNGTVSIEVRDTGRGMSRTELDRAFEDFHTTKPNGAGLGLSVVRRLVGDLGGSLRVETAPGRGSTFTVELPARRGEDAT